MWVGRRFFCRAAARSGPKAYKTSRRSASLRAKTRARDLVVLFVFFVHSHSARGPSHEASLIISKNYCRRLSAGLRPLVISLATTGIYNYKTLFWSSTSFPLLLPSPLHAAHVSCLWQWVVDPGHQRRLTQDGERGHHPVQGVEVDEPCSLSSLRSVGQTCNHALEARRRTSWKGSQESPNPLATLVLNGLVSSVMAANRPDSPIPPDRALMSSKEMIPHKSSFQCRYGLPSPGPDIRSRTE